MRRSPGDPVLITDAAHSPEEDLRRREHRYLAMMGLRAVCLIVAVVLVMADAPLLWLWLILCGLGMVLLPWFAVLLANDRLPKDEHRMKRYRRRPPAPPKSLPVQSTGDRKVIDPDE